MNPDEIKRADLKKSFEGTNFPSVYINLCTEGKQRMVPPQNNGSAIAKDGDLSIGIKFGGTGATQDVTYVIYLFYTDCNMTLDLRTRKFSPYYNLK